MGTAFTQLHAKELKRFCNKILLCFDGDSAGQKATLKAIEIAKDMRDEGYSVVYDLNGRSLRAQMKYADKCNAKYNVVIGDNEVDTKTAILKDMATGEQSEISLETFVSGYYSITLDSQLKDLEINGEAFDFNSLFLGGQNDD